MKLKATAGGQLQQEAIDRQQASILSIVQGVVGTRPVARSGDKVRGVVWGRQWTTRGVLTSSLSSGIFNLVMNLYVFAPECCRDALFTLPQRGAQRGGRPWARYPPALHQLEPQCTSWPPSLKEHSNYQQYHDLPLQHMLRTFEYRAIKLQNMEIYQQHFDEDRNTPRKHQPVEKQGYFICVIRTCS